MAAEAAVGLECDLLVQTGGPRAEGGLDRTIAGLLLLHEALGDLPIRVALEPHMGSQILHAEECDRLMAELPAPRFGITVDTGHFHSAGVDWKAIIRDYPERIYNVHLKDHIGPQSVAIGAGEIDVAGLIAELRGIGYEGALAIEMEVTDPENLHVYIGEAYGHMVGLLGG